MYHIKWLVNFQPVHYHKNTQVGGAKHISIIQFTIYFLIHLLLTFSSVSVPFLYPKIARASKDIQRIGVEYTLSLFSTAQLHITERQS